MKCTVRSEHGSVMVIPREGNMVRLYIQMSSLANDDSNFRREATKHEIQESAKKILQPYYIDWDHVEWYSVYPIGQGISQRYTLDQRVFLGGDACHTHSVSSDSQGCISLVQFSPANKLLRSPKLARA